MPMRLVCHSDAPVPAIWQTTARIFGSSSSAGSREGPSPAGRESDSSRAGRICFLSTTTLHCSSLTTELSRHFCTCPSSFAASGLVAEPGSWYAVVRLIKLHIFAVGGPFGIRVSPARNYHRFFLKEDPCRFIERAEKRKGRIKVGKVP